MLNKEIKKVKGIVLFSNKVKDDSAIVRIFTNYSNQEFYLKNVYKLKSNLKSGLLVGNFIEFDFIESNSIYIIKSINTLFDCSKYYLNYSYSLIISYVCECLYRYENDSYIKNNGVEKYAILLSKLEESNLLTFILIFLSTLIEDLGLKPNISTCNVCNSSKNIISFSFQDGGYICKDCFNKKYNEYTNMDLYVIKFAFSIHNNDDLKKEISKDNVIKIIREFNSYLENTFSYNQSKTLIELLKQLKL